MLFIFLSENGRADVIRDFKTGDSLCYAFIGESCYIVTVGFLSICVNVCVLLRVLCLLYRV